MGQGASQAKECDSCSRITALKFKAEPIERAAGKALRTGEERSPDNDVAAEWHSGASAILRKEIASHAKCEKCGILMGPGHIEAGSTSLCGTCQCRVSTGADNGGPSLNGSRVGRRGWHSDYTIKQ